MLKGSKYKNHLDFCSWFICKKTEKKVLQEEKISWNCFSALCSSLRNLIHFCESFFLDFFRGFRNGTSGVSGFVVSHRVFCNICWGVAKWCEKNLDVIWVVMLRMGMKGLRFLWKSFFNSYLTGFPLMKTNSV